MIQALLLVIALVGPSLQVPSANSGGSDSNETQRAKRDTTTPEKTNQCGKVPQSAFPFPLLLNSPLPEGQWPWHIAIYQIKAADSKYICGGTLVSPRHVITAASCVTKAVTKKIVDKRALTVYLGKTNLRTSYEGVQIRLVDKITLHPEFNSSTYDRNLAILELKDPVSYTNWVQPACLWPDDQQDFSTILGKKGSVVGWGIDETDELSETLKLVEMPVVDAETCIRSYSEFFTRFTSNYTYCAGARVGKSVCNGDSGGGMVFRSGDTWYLRGLMSVAIAKKGESKCDPTHYAIFTDLAKMLPWIKENVGDL